MIIYTSIFRRVLEGRHKMIPRAGKVVVHWYYSKKFLNPYEVRCTHVRPFQPFFKKLLVKDI
jgi:hypothetical protein